VSAARLPPRALLLVALLAVATRVLFQVQVRGDDGPVGTLSRHLLGDERAYDDLARGFADGTLSRERSFYQEPLYSWLLGLAYRVAPPPPIVRETAVVRMAPVHLAVIGVQHALGVLTCVAIAVLGARAFAPRVGLLAGLMAALSGPLVFAEGQLLKEGAALLLWTVSLHLWLDVLEDKGRLRAALLGLLLGLGVLLRGNTYILLALVLLSCVALRVGGRRRPLQAAVVGVCALLAISPATLHNLRRGEIVLSTYQSGANAAIGMPDDARPWGGLVYEPLRSGHGDALFEERDAVAVAEAALGRRLSGPEVSRFYWRRVADVIARRPAVAAQRLLRKLASTFHPEEVPDVKDWAFFGQVVPLLATPLSDLALFGPLALLGFLLLTWRGAGPLVVRGGVLAVMLTLALFYVFGRYRLSAAPGLWILAAGALVAGWQRVAAAKGARRAAWCLGLVGLAAGAVWAGRQPLRQDKGGLMVSWSNLASVEMAEAALASGAAGAREHRDAAVAAAREALRIAPLYPEGWAMLVRALDLRTPLVEPLTDEANAEAVRMLLVMEGLRTGARVDNLFERPLPEQLAAAAFLRDQPTLPGKETFVSAALAWAAARVSQSIKEGPFLELALRLIEESLRLEPDNPQGLVQKGLTLKRLGRNEEAEAAYRAAMAAGVESVELLNNLGNLLIRMGRGPEAVPLLRRALELDPGNDTIRSNLERALAGSPP